MPSAARSARNSASRSRRIRCTDRILRRRRPPKSASSSPRWRSLADLRERIESAPGLPINRSDDFFGYRSEEHTSELQSLMRISYAVFCLKQKKNTQETTNYMKLSRNNSQYIDQIKPPQNMT